MHFLRHVKSAEMMNSHGQDLIFTLLEFNFYLPYHRRALILQPDLATSQGRRCPGTQETCHIRCPQVLTIPKKPPPSIVPGQEGAALLESCWAAPWAPCETQVLLCRDSKRKELEVFQD